MQNYLEFCQNAHRIYSVILAYRNYMEIRKATSDDIGRVYDMCIDYKLIVDMDSKDIAMHWLNSFITEKQIFLIAESGDSIG